MLNTKLVAEKLPLDQLLFRGLSQEECKSILQKTHDYGKISLVGSWNATDNFHSAYEFAKLYGTNTVICFSKNDTFFKFSANYYRTTQPQDIRILDVFKVEQPAITPALRYGLDYTEDRPITDRITFNALIKPYIDAAGTDFLKMIWEIRNLPGIDCN